MSLMEGAERRPIRVTESKFQRLFWVTSPTALPVLPSLHDCLSNLWSPSVTNPLLLNDTVDVPCSSRRPIAGRVAAIMRQQRPEDPRVFVGQGHSRNVLVPPAQETLEPLIRLMTLCSSTRITERAPWMSKVRK